MDLIYEYLDPMPSAQPTCRRPFVKESEATGQEMLFDILEEPSA